MTCIRLPGAIVCTRSRPKRPKVTIAGANEPIGVVTDCTPTRDGQHLSRVRWDQGRPAGPPSVKTGNPIPEGTRIRIRAVDGAVVRA